MQTFARKLNLIALALGAALTAPGCATDWFSSSSSDYVAGELSQDVDNLPDPNAPPTPPKRSAIVSPLGAPFKESPDRLLLQANAYFEQGKFHDSSRLYQKYLATSEAATAPPTVLGQAHYRIAVVARKKLNFAEAKREFEIALRYEPQNQQYRFDLGKSAFDGADYATADAAFSALIAQNPNYPQAQYYYGLTLLEGTRRAEAIAPLTKAVGELEAAALLTDKYYALGETENAAAWESQTTQIAARLGRPVPAFPNKPAFASTAQPQNPTQSAPVVQTQNPTQSAPVAQTQNPAQSAPVAQTQGPAQVAPTTQTQDSAQVAPTTQTQDSVQVAPTTQTQGPAQVAPTTQTQGPAQVAPVDQTQGPAQVAPTTQTQGPAPFVATVAPPTSEESVASADVATLESATVDDGESLAQAAPSDELPCQNSAQETDLKTLIVQTDEPVVPSPVLAVQNAESQENSENTQSLTAHIGRRNPGLFASPTKSDSAASTDVKIDFRPGSISTAAPLVAQTIPTTQEPQVAQTIPATQEPQVAQTTPAAQDAQVAQTTPAAQDAQVAQTNPAPQTAQTAPFFGPRFPEASRFDAETSFRLVDRLVELENCVAEYFAPLAPIYETAPSPFPIAEPAELYAVAPSPSDFSIGAEEEFDENDDFAFASSGAPQTPVATSAPATIGGFGSYQAPTFDASPVVPVLTPVQPLAQAAPTTQFPQVAQAAPTTQFPPVAPAAPTPHFLQAAQAVPTAQTPLVAQAAPAAQFPQVAQAAPTTQFPQVAQAVPTAQTPQVAQAVPTAQTPLVAQAAPAAQFPQVAQAAPAAQFPQVAQAAPTAVSQYAAPNAGSRRPTTPEERLQAAIAAGAEVREISPEEYRRAVSVGLNGQAQPR